MFSGLSLFFLFFLYFPHLIIFFLRILFLVGLRHIFCLILLFGELLLLQNFVRICIFWRFVHVVGIYRHRPLFRPLPAFHIRLTIW